MTACVAILFWKPHMGAVGSSLLLLLLAGWVGLTYRRLLGRHPRKRARLLLLPKLAILALLMAALFDPQWGIAPSRNEPTRVIAALDVSSSMEVADRTDTPRAQRARRILTALEAELRGDVTFDVFEFDTNARPSAAAAATSAAHAIRQTDIGTSLATLSDRAETANAAAVLLFTDGGDEPVRIARAPNKPLYIVGMGTDGADWNDVRIAEVEHPRTVEPGSTFEIEVDIELRGDAAFTRRIESLTIALEELVGDEPIPLESIHRALEGTRLRERIRLPAGQKLQRRRFLVRVQPVDGEISSLNNRCQFDVNVQKSTSPVFLFANTVGWETTTLRRALDEEDGILLTALTRLTDARYIVQGNTTLSPSLQTGFPGHVEELAPYTCLIVGLPALLEFAPAQLAAVRDYVDGGGALVILGGAPPGQGAALVDETTAALLPWTLPPGGARPVTGSFPLSPGPGAFGHPVADGLMQRGPGATPLTLQALDLVGHLKPGAAVFFQTSFEGRTVPAIAIQPYGKGVVLAMASNTLWRWRRVQGAPRRTYDLFWRRVVRYLGGVEEGGRFLRVAWDRPLYRPGEEAHVTLHVFGPPREGALEVEGSLRMGDTREPLDIEAEGRTPARYAARIFFPQRGRYTVRFRARAGATVLEEYEKELVVAPRLNEGAVLERADAFLARLTLRAGDRYVREPEAQVLVEDLRRRSIQAADYRSVSVLEYGGIYLTLLLAVLLLEWLIRRKLNLF